MTHTGYTFKRPSLKNNYVQVLTTLGHLNSVDCFPTRKQLRKAVTWEVADIWNDNRGYNRILQKLEENSYITTWKDGSILITQHGHDLIRSAANHTAKNI